MKKESCCLILSGLVFLFLWGGVPETRADETEGHGMTHRAVQPETVQKMCPVIPGNKIDPNIFTEYRGKKVYFCCNDCKAKFLKAPEKYLDRLPQVASTVHAHGISSPKGSGVWESRLMILVKPFGMATLTLLITTACAGYFMRKKPKVLFKWHKRLAYTTVVVALSHAVLVLITH